MKTCLGIVLSVCLGAPVWAPVWAQPASAAGQAVSVVFAGDTVLDDAPGALIARGGDPFAAFAGIFAAADVRMANLECVVATVGSAGDKNFTFRAHPRVRYYEWYSHAMMAVEPCVISCLVA